MILGRKSEKAYSGPSVPMYNNTVPILVNASLRTISNKATLTADPRLPIY